MSFTDNIAGSILHILMIRRGISALPAQARQRKCCSCPPVGAEQRRRGFGEGLDDLYAAR